MALTTIDSFLEPWHAPDADDFHHKLADPERSSSIDRRYELVGETEVWQAFCASSISSNAEMRALLDRRFRPRWQAWLPDLARVIYNERQLESLYSATLMTRLNIAFQNAIPPNKPRVTIIICPGSFESRGVDDGGPTTILPDWVAVEGTHTPYDKDFPSLEQLWRERKILAVGDTKLVRQETDASDAEEEPNAVVDGTHSCHRAYLGQVQHYAHMLGTRFGFVLTNKELVLAQFLRETEGTPRAPRQRGLRSWTLTHQLERGVPSDFQSSEPQRPGDREEGGEVPFYTPQSSQKRRHASDDSPALPRYRPPITEYPASDECEGLPSSPPIPLSQLHNFSSSARGAPPGARAGVEDTARSSHQGQPSPSPYLASRFPTSSSRQMTSSEQSLQPSSDSYIPSFRDGDIERTLVRSFRIPNRCDVGSMDRKEDEEEDEEMMHPAKALFAFVMHAYIVGLEGRTINPEELEFFS